MWYKNIQLNTKHILFLKKKQHTLLVDDEKQNIDQLVFISKFWQQKTEVLT